MDQIGPNIPRNLCLAGGIDDGLWLYQKRRLVVFCDLDAGNPFRLHAEATDLGAVDKFDKRFFPDPGVHN